MTASTFYSYLLCLCLLPAATFTQAARSPEAVVAETSQRMIDALTENEASLKDNPEKIYELIENIVMPHFDVEYVVRLILGKYWRRANPGQRVRFRQAFKVLVMNSYTKALLEYSGEKVKVLPVSGDLSEVRTLIVRSLLDSKDAQPVEVNYRMRKKDDEWKVIDFTVEGVSLILNYKHSFSEQIRAKGLDALIESIEHKNATFKF